MLAPSFPPSLTARKPNRCALWTNTSHPDIFFARTSGAGRGGSESLSLDFKIKGLSYTWAQKNLKVPFFRGWRLSMEKTQAVAPRAWDYEECEGAVWQPIHILRIWTPEEQKRKCWWQLKDVEPRSPRNISWMLVSVLISGPCFRGMGTSGAGLRSWYWRDTHH